MKISSAGAKKAIRSHFNVRKLLPTSHPPMVRTGSSSAGASVGARSSRFMKTLLKRRSRKGRTQKSVRRRSSAKRRVRLLILRACFANTPADNQRYILFEVHIQPCEKRGKRMFGDREQQG